MLAFACVVACGRTDASSSEAAARSAAPAASTVAPAPSTSTSTSTAAVRASCEAFPWGFPHSALVEAARCQAPSDCAAVEVGGGCVATKRAGLADVAALYRDWVRLGCHRPSGSPTALSEVPGPEISARCGPDVASVTCQGGTCELTPSDCEYQGMRRAACEAKGGSWGGCTPGRGRLPGCNLPTTDEGKACRDKRDCQGACVNGMCSRLRVYKGCGAMIDGKPMCVE